MRIRVLLVLFCLPFAFVLAQPPVAEKSPMEEEGNSALLDSLRKKQDEAALKVVYTAKYIKYTTVDLMKDSLRLMPLDTVQNLARFKAGLHTPEQPNLSLSTYGTALRPLLFEPNQQMGFQMGRNSWNYYMLQPKQMNYYQARVPYTELQYFTSDSREDLLRVVMAQNPYKQFNWGLNFDKMSSDGFFANQSLSLTNFALFSWYRSNSGRYNLMTNFCSNNVKIEENGGQVLTNIFDQNKTVPVRALQTKLTNAFHTNKNMSVYAKQFLDLSVSKDGRSLPTQRLSHEFLIKSEEYAFSTPADTFSVFKNYFINTATTNDVSKLFHVQNMVDYSFYLRSTKLRNEVKVLLGAIHDYYEVRQYDRKQHLNNISLRGRLDYRFSEYVLLHADLIQVTVGEQLGDYKWIFGSDWQLGKSKLHLKASFLNQTPPLLYRNLWSNNLQWNNDLSKTQINQFSGEFDLPGIRLKAGVNYFLMANYVYLRQNSEGVITPYQENNWMNMLQAYLRKDFVWRKFHWENYLVYQVSDYLAQFTTPAFYTFNSLYYQGKFFKSLHLNFGLDVRYYSRFTNPNYAPSIGQYYYSDSASKQGDMPIIDLWLSALIRKANIFVKYEFLNYQWNGNNGVYQVNGYPSTVSMIRWGIIWRMFE